MRITHALLKRLPKVELHCHLDGSLRVDTVLDLAQKDSIELPASNIDDLRKALVIGDKRGSLEDYIKRFDITLSVMQTPESLQRCAYELIEDVAKENVRYIEIRYSPILHTAEGMTMGESVEAVQQGLDKGKKDFGVHSGIIICGIRHISPEASLKLADIAVRYRNKEWWGLTWLELRKIFLPKSIGKRFISSAIIMSMPLSTPAKLLDHHPFIRQSIIAVPTELDTVQD